MPEEKKEEQKTPTRNEEIGRVYARFGGIDEPSQAELDQASKDAQLENPVSVGEYADYHFQVTTDQKLVELLPKITAALTKLKYIPAFAPEKVRKEVLAENDEIRVEVCKAIEEAAIPYILLDNIATEFGEGVSQIIKGACTTLNNRTGATLMDIAQRHFKVKNITLKEIASYEIKTEKAPKLAEEQGEGDVAAPEK